MTVTMETDVASLIPRPSLDLPAIKKAGGPGDEARMQQCCVAYLPPSS